MGQTANPPLSLCLLHLISLSSRLSSLSPSLLHSHLDFLLSSLVSSAMSRSGRGYDAFNEPLGSAGQYRRSEDDYDSYSANHGPGSGLSAFYANNKKRILICLGVSLVLIVIIAVVAAAAGKKSDGGGPDLPGKDDEWTTIGSLPAYREGSDPRVLLFLPDVRGRSNASIELVRKYGESGFSTYFMDYFDGGAYNSSNPNHVPAVAAQRVRDAINDLRMQDHVTSIQVTGYCYGGGIAVLLADGTARIDSAVAAHAALVGGNMGNAISNILIPTFFVMVGQHAQQPSH